MPPCGLLAVNSIDNTETFSHRIDFPDRWAARRPALRSTALNHHEPLTAGVHAADVIRSVGKRVSAEIVKLSDYRISDAADSEIDLATAVDVAIRDLREILSSWGSELARQRAEECELTLRRAFSGCVGRSRFG